MLEALFPELVFEILQYCLPQFKLTITKPHLFPWYLGHICSSWRTVFLSSPQFWSTIDVNLHRVSSNHRTSTYENFVERHEQAIQLVTACIERSKGHPLSFSFRMHDASKAGLNTCSLCHVMLEAFVAQSLRWEEAYLMLPSSEIPALFAVKGRLPLLRSFQLLSANQYPAPITGLLTDTTHLSRLHISPVECFNIDWSSLTVIHFVLPFPRTFLGCIQQANRLEELDLRSQFVQRIMHNTFPPVSLPLLKTLRVCSTDTLLLLEAPSLEELCLRGDCPLYIPDPGSSALGVIRFFGSIKHLKHLSYTFIDDFITPLIIRHLPVVPAISFYDLRAEHLVLLNESLTMCRLKTLKIGFSKFWSNVFLSDVLKAIKVWRLPDGSTGIGRFERLAEFEFTIYQLDLSDKDAKILEAIRGHIQEHGIQCSIQLLNGPYRFHDSHPDFPPFDKLSSDAPPW